MSIYASTPPKNIDPYPYVWEGHSETNQMRSDTDMYRKGAPVRFPGYHNRPRPQFDHPRAHSANPILTTFRAWSDTTPEDVRTMLADLDGYMNGGEHPGDLITEALGQPCSYGDCERWTRDTDAQGAHAHKVFTRWLDVYAAAPISH